jgi:SPP1 family predicted phage head-tail adaptor
LQDKYVGGDNIKFITPVFLISFEISFDDAGDKVKAPVEKKVLSNYLSIGQKEFYEAQTSGMKPELKIEVREFEYNNEDTLKYNGVVYNIIRTFPNVKKGTVELTCSKPIMKVM